jgi:hypothetical protein
MNTMTEPASRVHRIGPDRVTVTDQEVVIEAKRAMPDWEVREFQIVPIYFEDGKYHLVDKRKGTPPYAWRYLLQPWPVENTDMAKRFHTYDAEAVAQRDGEHAGEIRGGLGYAFLLPLIPFLGLFWSKVQERLGRFGFVPRTLTSLSIFTVFGLAFGQLVFFSVSINGSIRGGKVMLGGLLRLMAGTDQWGLGPVNVPLGWLDAALFVALVADAAMRYTYYLREDQWTGGFLEWLLPKRRPRI